MKNWLKVKKIYYNNQGIKICDLSPHDTITSYKKQSMIKRKKHQQSYRAAIWRTCFKKK